MSRKPKVNLDANANYYAGPDERIIEFSSDGGGGLISFKVVDGHLHVSLYRLDRAVRVMPTDTSYDEPADRSECAQTPDGWICPPDTAAEHVHAAGWRVTDAGRNVLSPVPGGEHMPLR